MNFNIFALFGKFVLVMALSGVNCYAQNLRRPMDVPPDMAFLQGGPTPIGSETGAENEKPVFQTFINPFYLDQTPVTVAQFRLFVKINRYITDAEKKGESAVYQVETGTWEVVKGANWLYPYGPEEGKASSEESVRQVSWNDAQAYALWVGKRLPSEYELEYAIREKDKLSLKGLDGNLWQWCDNWYSLHDENTYYEQQLNREKTIKGGGLIQKEEAKSVPYRASIRSSALPSTASSDLGFRCVKDIR